MVQINGVGRLIYLLPTFWNPIKAVTILPGFEILTECNSILRSRYLSQYPFVGFLQTAVISIKQTFVAKTLFRLDDLHHIAATYRFCFQNLVRRKSYISVLGQYHFYRIASNHICVQRQIH